MNILIADDHPIYVEGLVNLLQSYDFTVVGTAADGKAAVEQVQRLQPDIVLMDANMPGMNGIEATKRIRKENPETKVIILTGIEDDSLLFDAVKAGASGFLLKKLDGDSLYKSLLELQAGKNPFSPGMGDLLLGKISSIEKEPRIAVPLSARQLRILEYLDSDMTYKEIGKKLFISEQTVKYHIAKMKQNTCSKSKLQLLEFYRANF
ncbi:MAG: response regulator transcription factor [Treponema sp.]|jgi:two-component system NarL family response regulator|nr:response regulator transcription factor [Treponema sp.]